MKGPQIRRELGQIVLAVLYHDLPTLYSCMLDRTYASMGLRELPTDLVESFA